MSSTEPGPTAARIRREPPRFRAVAVRRVAPMSAHLVRITLGGAELDGLSVDEPAASVRLLIPAAPGEPLVVPSWKGNEFLLPDGRRPTIRTFTPRRVGPGAKDDPELDLDIVLHDDGTAARWAAAAEPGAPAAVSGPGRGYTVDHDAPAFLLAGDESAIPAMSQLLESLPDVPTQVHIEVARPDARLALAEHPRATVAWHDLAPGARPGDAFAAAVRDGELPSGVRIWVAGEAAAVQRVRRFLFDDRGIPRAHANVRGYWKHGRAGDDAER